MRKTEPGTAECSWDAIATIEEVLLERERIMHAQLGKEMQASIAAGKSVSEAWNEQAGWLTAHQLMKPADIKIVNQLVSKRCAAILPHSQA